MPPQATLVTLEDFQQMPPPPPGVKRELIEGVVTEMGKALGGHEKVKSNFHELFVELCNRKTPWAVVSESEFVLGDAMDAIPDVAIVRRRDFLAAPTDKHFSFPPVLAVEVVSSEKAEDLEAKVRGYLTHGVATVLVAYPWVAYQKLGEIQVRTANGYLQLTSESRLELPQLFPDWSADVSDFFLGV